MATWEGLIGANMSEPHTSGLHCKTHVYMYVCLFAYVRVTINWKFKLNEWIYEGIYTYISNLHMC